MAKGRFYSVKEGTLMCQGRRPLIRDPGEGSAHVPLPSRVWVEVKRFTFRGALGAV